MRMIRWLELSKTTSLLLRVMFVLCSASLFAGEDSIKLKDHLGRHWRNECVVFELNESQLRNAKAGQALVGPHGPVAYQLITGAGPASIAFQTNLNPFETREFRFSAAATTKADDAAKRDAVNLTGLAGLPSKPEPANKGNGAGEKEISKPSDLKIEDKPETLVLSNNHTGIALRKRLGNGQGPIDGVRVNSGTWIGTSRFELEGQISVYAVEVTANGPVFAEAICRMKFGSDASWDFTVRIYANEPVVLIDERFNVSSSKTRHIIDLGRNFAPDTLINRRGKGQFVNSIYSVTDGEVYVLEPWVNWWERERQGQCFSLFKNTPGQDPIDLISVAAREAGVWVDPAIPRDQRAPIQMMLTKSGDSIQLPMQLKRGVRKWMFTALNARDCLAPFKDKKDMNGASLADSYMIKHGQFPLNAVKDYILTWPDQKTSYPRLFVTKETLPELRKNVPNPEHFLSKVGEYREARPSVFPLEVYYVSGDEGVGKRISENVIPALQNGIESYLLQPGLPLGVGPHFQQSIATPMAAADAALSYEKLAPEMRERILAQLAFLGYVFGSPNYWSPERGYRANPNMTTAVNGYKMMIGCLLPSHPKSKEWCHDALTELKHQLNEWSDENGAVPVPLATMVKTIADEAI